MPAIARTNKSWTTRGHGDHLRRMSNWPLCYKGMGGRALSVNGGSLTRITRWDHPSIIPPHLQMGCRDIIGCNGTGGQRGCKPKAADSARAANSRHHTLTVVIPLADGEPIIAATGADSALSPHQAVRWNRCEGPGRHAIERLRTF